MSSGACTEHQTQQEECGFQRTLRHIQILLLVIQSKPAFSNTNGFESDSPVLYGLPSAVYEGCKAEQTCAEDQERGRLRTYFQVNRITTRIIVAITRDQPNTFVGITGGITRSWEGPGVHIPIVGGYVV